MIAFSRNDHSRLCRIGGRLSQGGLRRFRASCQSSPITRHHYGNSAERVTRLASGPVRCDAEGFAGHAARSETASPSSRRPVLQIGRRDRHPSRLQRLADYLLHR